MRKRRWVLIVVALAAAVAAIVFWTLPAEVAYRYGKAKLGPVTLTGIRGTLWNGHADSIAVAGQDLGQLDWTAEKLPALSGRLVADLRIQGAGLDLVGDLERAPGELVLRDVRFRVPAARFADAFAEYGLVPTGTLAGTLVHARLRGVRASEVKGEAQWTGAGVSGAQELKLSDVTGTFASLPDGGLGGTFKDVGEGPLAVDGRFTAHLHATHAEAVLRPRSDDPALLGFLERYGQTQADGSTRLRFDHQALPTP